MATAGLSAQRTGGLGAAWRNPRVRGIIYQIVVVGLLAALIAFLVNNTITNLAIRQIRTGYDFLAQQAGFNIGEHVIPFAPSDSYGRAIVVGFLNTLKVSILGIIIASAIGVLMGIARLSSNWLLAKVAMVYIEIVRNIPLLLQLFFWYAIISQLLPNPRDALVPVPGFALSKMGLQMPALIYDPGQTPLVIIFLISMIAAYFYYRWARRRQAATGREPKLLLPIIGLIVLPTLVAYLVLGAPLHFDVPTFTRFNYQGGTSITPEFLALLVGLSIYTGSFIAENVRSGILGVPWGQSEASSALGLRRGQQMRLVVLPQALRIIVPPTTSQYLNLTKNSSLAVAIGYPDLLSVTNTTLNQTGQAIECISIMMGIYLVISLAISLFMNWYNKRVALVER
ncbi:amino acid ABC transporter membrane protein 1, PAAT family [Arboricoccus pini]|uniref:Amino acid ABC transporter membrane protein 1, PAAT family n=1 Tax=Arboricoccus pini TaxID=1963835 RepID=A0A212QN56_9PROT|nr:amino acid ABC transporter permease [Arboricoccus pini]SNB60794.1 amino acid ABC transporter membrane protein 1, PAAT family [Arboricoccus pini]